MKRMSDEQYAKEREFQARQYDMHAFIYELDRARRSEAVITALLERIYAGDESAWEGIKEWLQNFK